MTDTTGSPSRVRIGFVGAGNATRNIHLRALQNVADLEVVAIADPDPEALGLALQQCQTARGVKDYQAMLASAEVDAIAICVPVRDHAEIALAAMDAGKHLFIEKPLAMTIQECDQMIARGVNLPLTIQVGFNTRWHRLVRRARKLIEQGEIGKLDVLRSILVSMHREMSGWRKKRATGGGAILEMGVHHFDLWRFLTGLEVEEVSAQIRTGSWEDESATVSARLTNGVLATLTLAVKTSQNNALEIYGDKGSLNLAFYRYDGLETYRPDDIPGSMADRKTRFVQGLAQLPHGIATMRRGGEWQLSYVEQWRHFVDRIQQGLPAEVGLQEGRQSLAIALAAWEASANGTTVKVPTT
ncbi:MAG: Gfo/Idh/MocA family oxidoreductase [Planctomycetaceae bacterium]|nr:Gfo/Idh/MocA family oxidoreductase [Planctomycetaceae bacterium]